MESAPNESAIPKKQVFHKELSFKVIGCAQKVHRILGPGFPEGVYHKALCYELKALDELNGNHIAQAISYLKATGLKLAILMNFGTESLETHRVVL